MSQQAISTQYSFDPLAPLYNGIWAEVYPANLQPSTSYVSGQVMAWITGSAADVQTVSTTGTPGGGTFTLTGFNPLSGLNVTTAAIAYNASTATLQAELVKAANFGAGNVVVSGSAGSWVVTFGGLLANCPVPVLALGTNAFTGGSSPSLTVAHTTIGRTAGTYGKYDSTVAAAPAVPVPSGTGSGSGFGAGTHLVEVTGVNAQGETTPSPAAPVILTAGQKIRVAALAGLDTSFTVLNVYVDGTFVGTAAVSAGTSTQTDFDVAALTASSVSSPRVNTAYTIPNGAGCQTAKGLLKYTCKTDAAGNVSFSSTNSTGEWGETEEANQLFQSGLFDTSKLTGLDAKAVTDLGRLRYGTTTAGCLRVL